MPLVACVVLQVHPLIFNFHASNAAALAGLLALSAEPRVSRKQKKAA